MKRKIALAAVTVSTIVALFAEPGSAVASLVDDTFARVVQILGSTR